MESLVKSDIFFFTTTAAIIIVTAVVIIALFYVVKILRDIKDISETVKDESELIAKDIDDARENIREHGSKMSYFINKFTPSGFKKAKKRKVKRK